MSERMKRVWDDKEGRERILSLRKGKNRGGIPMVGVLCTTTGERFESLHAVERKYGISSSALCVGLKRRKEKGTTQTAKDGTKLTFIRL